MSDGIKYGIIVVALAAAGYLVWSNLSQGSPAGRLENEPMYWTCLNPECKNEFEITKGKAAEYYKQSGFESVPCPKCGKVQTAVAYRCPNCNKNYEPVGHGARPKVCPNCKKPLTPDSTGK